MSGHSHTERYHRTLDPPSCGRDRGPSYRGITTAGRGESSMTQSTRNSTQLSCYAGTRGYLGSRQDAAAFGHSPTRPTFVGRRSFGQVRRDCNFSTSHFLLTGVLAHRHIGSPSEACLVIEAQADGSDLSKLFAEEAELLPILFGVSSVTVETGRADSSLDRPAETSWCYSERCDVGGCNLRVSA
jgi:hypothetical protein